MRLIELDNWPRQQQYNFFKGLDCPYFSITANLAISTFHRYVKDHDLPFFIAILYTATRTANEIPEFRCRIRGDQVIEHESVNPSFTVLTEQKLFSICSVTYDPNFSDFARTASEVIVQAKERVRLQTESERDDLLYMTCIPWVSFTSISHPVHLHPADSIPRIAWGKYYKENNQLLLPFSIQAHHALMDGYHVGRYFELIQNLFDQPENYLHG